MESLKCINMDTDKKENTQSENKDNSSNQDKSPAQNNSNPQNQEPSRVFQTNKTVKIFSNIDAFDSSFPNTPKEGIRRKALENYFSAKGIVKVFESTREWPRLSYPDNLALDRKLEELGERKKLFEGMLTQWKKSYGAAANYHQNNQIKKLGEPLYWKHLAKMASDKDYRKDFGKVKMPVHLVSDNRWKPMVKMFVNDIDYRKQLVETVQTSIVYKNDKRVARYADELKEFRMGASGKKVGEFEKKISELKQLEETLKEFQKWSKEGN